TLGEGRAGRCGKTQNACEGGFERRHVISDSEVGLRVFSLLGRKAAPCGGGHGADRACFAMRSLAVRGCKHAVSRPWNGMISDLFWPWRGPVRPCAPRRN